METAHKYTIEADLVQADEVITLSALILVHASPHELIGTSCFVSYTSWKMQEKSVVVCSGSVWFRWCVYYVTLLFLEWLLEFRWCQSFGSKAPFYYSPLSGFSVFGQVWFNVNGSAEDTFQKRFCMFILYKICGVQKSNNTCKNDPIFFLQIFISLQIVLSVSVWVKSFEMFWNFKDFLVFGSFLY